MFAGSTSPINLTFAECLKDEHCTHKRYTACDKKTGKCACKEGLVLIKNSKCVAGEYIERILKTRLNDCSTTQHYQARCDAPVFSTLLQKCCNMFTQAMFCRAFCVAPDVTKNVSRRKLLSRLALGLLGRL